MNFPFNLPGFSNEAPAAHDGLVEVDNTPSMRHEVDNVLHPMLEIREHNVVSSDMHIAQLGYQRLGAEVMAGIQQAVAEQMGSAPAEAPRAENLSRAQSAVSDALATQAVQSSVAPEARQAGGDDYFWLSDDPDEQKQIEAMKRRAAYDNIPVQEPASTAAAAPASHNSYGDNEAERFFNSVGIPTAEATVAELTARAEAEARANQYAAAYNMRVETGMAGPQVSRADQQEVYADAISGAIDEESPEVRGARVEQAMRNLHEVHDQIDQGRVRL